MTTKPALATKQPEPDDDESHSDFIERCTEEGYSEDECEVAWEDRAARGVTGKTGPSCDPGVKTRQVPAVVVKTHAADVQGLEFILSDDSADRMGDIIEQDGWKLANFRKNPITLFGHNSGFPVGKWKKIRVEGKELRAELELAPEGTSQRIDENPPAGQRRHSQSGFGRLQADQIRASRRKETVGRLPIPRAGTSRGLTRERAGKSERARGGEKPRRL